MPFKAEHLGVDAHVGPPPLDVEQHEEIQAGGAVGEEGGKPRPLGAHVQPPGQDEHRVQEDVEEAPAHGADAGVHGGPLRPDEVGHHHIQNRGHRPKAHRPLGVADGGVQGLRGGPQQVQQGHLKGHVGPGEQQPGDHRAVKPKGGAAVHRVVVLLPQGPAHHAGGAHPEEVVHRVERQQQRGRQGDGGVLHRVVEHPHKVGVRQVVEHHHQRAEHRGDGQLHHRPGDGHGFEQFCLLPVFHIASFTPFPAGTRPMCVLSLYHAGEQGARRPGHVAQKLSNLPPETLDKGNFFRDFPLLPLAKNFTLPYN